MKSIDGGGNVEGHSVHCLKFFAMAYRKLQDPSYQPGIRKKRTDQHRVRDAKARAARAARAGTTSTGTTGSDDEEDFELPSFGPRKSAVEAREAGDVSQAACMVRWYLDSTGSFSCKDPVCLAHNLTFSTISSFNNHIGEIHRAKYQYRPLLKIKALDTRPTTRAGFLFADDDAFWVWVESVEDAKAQKAVKEKTRLVKRKVSGSEENGTETDVSEGSSASTSSGGLK